MLIRIPSRFYEDHVERDLPVPSVIKETQRYIWIDADSPHLSEFLDDAKHYAGDAISLSDFPDLIGVKASAKATVKAIEAALRSALLVSSGS